MRRAHYLKTNQRTEVPRHFIFVDTETKGEQITPTREAHTLWFGWALYVRHRKSRGKDIETTEWFRFVDAHSFWDWALSKAHKRNKLYVFAHNWNFDGSILYTATTLHDLEWKTLQYINEKPPFFLRIEQEKRFVCLVDTLNFFTTSLADLGVSIGIPKLTMPRNGGTAETWDNYCRRDVEVLRVAVESFIRFITLEDLGNFRPTLASQAMNAYRHRFMHHFILIHDNEKVCELERDSYFGGRVENFFLGEVNEPLYYLDVNSLYPFVMKDYKYPTQLRGTAVGIDLPKLKILLENYCVTARVVIETDEPVYPCRTRERLLFPTGRFTTTLSTPEIRHAIDNGRLRQVERLAWYASGDLFSDFVQVLYARRQSYAKAGNPAFAYLCKILLNSLYGKFGQSGRNWEIVRPAEPTDPVEWWEQDEQDGPVVKYRVRFDRIQRLEKDDESRDSFPAIAAHVTAYARMHMWRLMQHAGNQHTFYSDTDSLVVDAKGYERLAPFISDGILGSLKVEGISNRAVFYGPKDYHFGVQERHKGIRRNAVKIAKATWEQARFCSWDWHLGHDQEGRVFIDTITKTLGREYRKGNVGPTGWVTPFDLRF